MKTIADRLTAARKRARRSIRSLQQELHADRVPGSSYANVHAYFSGKTQPSVEFLAAVAAALDVRPAWLAFADGEMDLVRQAAEEVAREREPATDRLDAGSPAEQEARESLEQVMVAVESLGVSGIAEDVLRNYWFLLRDSRDDLPADSEGIASVLRRRFPRTVDTSVYVDFPSADTILFGEAVAAYALDFLAEPLEWGNERLEELRMGAPLGSAKVEGT